MKIAVVGSREFNQKELIHVVLNDVFPLMNTFISGGARGVDTWAEEWVNEWNKAAQAEAYKIEMLIIKPEWDKYGKRAGFIRNQEIIENADRVIAFWDGKSKGTKHSIDLAIQYKKPVDIYVRN